MKVTNYVNEAKRTCVVVVSGCELDVIRKVRKTFKGFGQDFGFRGHSSYIADSFRGKARCAPEDIFDAEVGLELARERAFAKYEKAFNKEIDYLIERVEILEEDITGLYK